MAQLLGVPLLIAFLGLLRLLRAAHVPASAIGALRRLHRRHGRRTSAARCSRTYLLPFEVTSVLILIAIIGAIVLARKEMD